ncbi:hypothetical protein [Sphingomonas xinjiangensis]|uniref:Uncharacterized protein n=1 Tax=Sphingomonas xinjiangensis TaxID=643568 RepID=A0A840Y9B4_9SPHN|nr:hypothetical protein [Sphingomonas xinjiangensis]MBB5709424.1 hypothetical protein [Sphingomonas xinjiangensis]
MAAFNPASIKPASKSAEFSKQGNGRAAKDVLLSAIDTQLALFKDPKKEGRRWFTVGKSETLLTLRYSNRALVLKDGEKSVAVPNDQFVGAMAYFKGEVEKGTYADQLTELEAANEERKTKMRNTRASKKAEKPA